MLERPAVTRQALIAALLLSLTSGTAAGDPVLAGLPHRLDGVIDVVLADADDDGLADLVALRQLPEPPWTRQLHWLRARGDGAFELPALLIDEVLAPSEYLFDMAAVDADGDGLQDLVLQTNDPIVLPALPGGGFGPAQPFEDDGTLLPMASADLDGNGLTDGVTQVQVGSVIGGSAHPVLQVALDLGGGQVATSLLEPVDWFEWYQEIVIGDLDGDDVPDLLVRTSLGATVTLRLHVGRGDGSFEAPLFTDLDPGLRDLALEDLDGDGRLDLLGLVHHADTGTDTVLVHRGLGDGSFAPPSGYTLTPAPQPAYVSLIVADVDGDGAADLLATFGPVWPPVPDATWQVTLLPGDGAGGFGDERVLPVSEQVQSWLVDDADGDGRTDVVSLGWVDQPPQGWLTLRRGADGSLVDLGGGAAGGPELELTGTPRAGALVSLGLATPPAPGADAWLLLGSGGPWQSLPAGLVGPFDAALVPLGAGAAGRWPDLPPGVPLFVQPLLVDGDGLLPGDAWALVTTP